VTTVSFGGTLAEALPEEIDALRVLEAVPKSVKAWALDAVPAGAEVIVTNGPLKGTRGTVDGSPEAFYLSVAVDSVRKATASRFRRIGSCGWTPEANGPKDSSYN